MKDCVTHHRCDCTEAELARLREENETHCSLERSMRKHIQKLEGALRDIRDEDCDEFTAYALAVRTVARQALGDKA